ncbi:unnamed protein product [Spirodela intermedia]|uniref:Reverse transcriptase Ty1/copia-type domain-containing protein n=1 Tax=Spirodela intermedia TaxID=51605 RepID=A0A7I8IIW9_SPIIN|nr:unnamed protein product [Spirodela intermedia]CAA6657758.1 unnamed protein product [Spirodela intermedia]
MLVLPKTRLMILKYFSTYEQINSGNILMKNDSSCKIVIHNLKKNLISLSTLQANDCKYSSLGQDFWVEVVSTTYYLVNKSPTSTINFQAPKETWELVEALKGQKVIDCKWVFKKKGAMLNSNDFRYKVQLVTKGYNQVNVLIIMKSFLMSLSITLYMFCYLLLPHII